MGIPPVHRGPEDGLPHRRVGSPEAVEGPERVPVTPDNVDTVDTTGSAHAEAGRAPTLTPDPRVAGHEVIRNTGRAVGIGPVGVGSRRGEGDTPEGPSCVWGRQGSTHGHGDGVVPVTPGRLHAPVPLDVPTPTRVVVDPGVRDAKDVVVTVVEEVTVTTGLKEPPVVDRRGSCVPVNNPSTARPGSETGVRGRVRFRCLFGP